MQTWVPLPPLTDFTLANLPYGIFSLPGENPRAGIALGDLIIDLPALERLGYLQGLGLPEGIFEQATWNPFIALGALTWKNLRKRLQELFGEGNDLLKPVAGQVLKDRLSAQLHKPVAIGNYTDFYSSEAHATNVGRMFRGEENALLPNWKHLPVAYHGRASSIVVSDTPIYRPYGQYRLPGQERPVFGVSQKLDFELEVAAVIGKENPWGTPVSVDQAAASVFGFVLFNDWSARDIQQWEYQPLGPFLGKNFASSISPWIVPLEAMLPFQVKKPEQHPVPLPYLLGRSRLFFHVQLEVALQPQGETQQEVICQTNYEHLYWHVGQHIAHHTISGCNLCIGDLLASGTISGTEPGSYGSMLELSWNGKAPLHLQSGQQRTFLADGDTVVMRGHAGQGNHRVGFGEVSGQILPNPHAFQPHS